MQNNLAYDQNNNRLNVNCIWIRAIVGNAFLKSETNLSQAKLMKYGNEFEQR